MSAATYFRRMAAGLCGTCGGPKSSADDCRCGPCQKKQRESKAKYKRGLWMPSERTEASVDKSPRCRCKLRLPCWRCVPTAADVAVRRVGE